MADTLHTCDAHKSAPRCVNSRGHGTGDPAPMRDQRTQPAYRVDAETGCWLWQNVPSSTGYGTLSVNRRTVLAHRWMYEQHVGPIPDGLHLDHLCRNPICVNPAHLEPVTNAENARRGARGVLLTHCPQGHAYDEDNTYIRPDTGGRQCRTCSRERRARWDAEHRDEANARSRAYYHASRHG